MSRKRYINDIDDDQDGLVDYSGDSDDDNKSMDDLPESTRYLMYRKSNA